MFHDLRRVLNDVCLDIVFICETKLYQRKGVNWCGKLGYENMFFMDAVGRSGGLCLMWKTHILISTRSFSKGHIDCLVE